MAHLTTGPLAAWPRQQAAAAARCTARGSRAQHSGQPPLEHMINTSRPRQHHSRCAAGRHTGIITAPLPHCTTCVHRAAMLPCCPVAMALPLHSHTVACRPYQLQAPGRLVHVPHTPASTQRPPHSPHPDTPNTPHAPPPPPPLLTPPPSCPPSSRARTCGPATCRPRGPPSWRRSWARAGARSTQRTAPRCCGGPLPGRHAGSSSRGGQQERQGSTVLPLLPALLLERSTLMSSRDRRQRFAWVPSTLRTSCGRPPLRCQR